MSQRLKMILVTFLILGSLFFLIIGLTSGKGFLIPVVTAIILSMVMNPVAHKLKSWGVKWGLAVFLSDLVIIAFIALIIFLLAAQANQVARNWPQIENRIRPKIDKVETFMNEKLNMQVSIPGGSGQDQNQGGGNQEKGSQQQGDGNQEQEQEQGNRQAGFKFSNIRDSLYAIISDVFSFLGDLLLMLIYVFFFMFYQKKFEETIVRMAPEEKRDKTRDVLKKSAVVAQQYLFGRFILILFLAAFYLTGYSILGLKYAFFIALIAAVFSLIPYVGNLVGLLLAIAVSFLSEDGGLGQIIGVVAVYAVAQFIESYILEPFIIGDRIDINPVAIIVGVVLGGVIWGVMGMLLAIPILGILKVIFDNVESLEALGYGLDASGISSGGGMEEKVKNWFKDKFKRK